MRKQNAQKRSIESSILLLMTILNYLIIGIHLFYPSKINKKYNI